MHCQLRLLLLGEVSTVLVQEPAVIRAPGLGHSAAAGQGIRAGTGQSLTRETAEAGKAASDGVMLTFLPSLSSRLLISQGWVRGQ